MAEVDCKKDWNTDIRREEAAGAELAWVEDGEAVDEHQNGKTNQRTPCTPRLRPAVEGQVGIVLGDAGFAETKKDNTAAHPADKARGIG